MRVIAKRIVDAAAPRATTSKTKRAAAELAAAKLRPHLANLMGSAGFRALLLRSLAMAGAELPWLRAVAVKGDGTLEGLDTPNAPVSAGDYSRGNVLVLAILLSLLVAFVGESLTLKLIRDVWPDQSFADLDSGTGDD